MVQGQVIFSGFGAQEGKCAGNRGRTQFDTVVAVFRPGQQGSLGPYIDRLGNGQEEEVASPARVVARYGRDGPARRVFAVGGLGGT
jgi:hypothetical protein